MCWISWGGWRAGAAAREGGRSTGTGPSRDPNRFVSGLSSRYTEAAAEKRLCVTVSSLLKRETMRRRSVLVTKFESRYAMDIHHHNFYLLLSIPFCLL